MTGWHWLGANVDALAKLHEIPEARVNRLPRRLPAWTSSWLQILPLAAILICMFVLPTALFLVVSFFDYDRAGIYLAFMLDNYREIFTSSSTLRVYASTLKFTLIVWAITLFLGFNIAHFLIFHVRNGKIRIVLLLLCAIPFFTSAIIRTIAWIPFLGRSGAFNQALLGLHITARPLDVLLFSDFSVVVAYVHLYTPLMIGPIANSLSKIDRSLLEAARDAGASRWQTMANLVIPLSKTGIALGSILVMTQCVDHQHRSVEEQHVEHKQRAERIEGPRPPVDWVVGMLLRHAKARHFTSFYVTSLHFASCHFKSRHFTSSLRMSTTRIRQATMMATMTTSIMALAAAGGYCIAWISVDSAETIEALWPPLI
jgi:putative spermidine/putrescine transport system permease protein